MKTEYSKVAFYDTDNDEFYQRGDDSNIIFGPLDKAKLYTGSRTDTLDIFNYIVNCSKRNLVLVDIKVTYEVDITRSSTVTSENIEKKNRKLRTEFDKLHTQAESDIDAMSDKDWKRWKKLKLMLKVIS